jgi:hypothetical protein
MGQNYGDTKRYIGKAVKKTSPTRTWPVYADYYSVVDEEDGKGYVVASISLFEPVPGEDGAYRGREPEDAARKNYPPLRNPEVVAALANLADDVITAEAVVTWAKEYGLLASSREDDVLVQPSLIGQGRISGYGCRESVSGFATAAGEVRTCLRIYEALSRPEDLNLEELSAEVRPLPGDAMRPWERQKGHERAWLFGVLGRMVQMRLHEHCYPQFNIYTRGTYPTGRFELSWGFHTLIGAIWLQMAWLLELLGDERSVSFCKLPDCRRVITFEPGKSADELGTIKDAHGKFKRNARGEYKDRSDRVFCRGRGCKQKYNYRKKAGWQGYG